MNKIYIGDIGTQIIANAGVDISDATSLKINVIYPDKTTAEYIATQFDDTTKAKAYILSDINLFTMAGDYLFNLEVVNSLGSWTGETFTIRVYEKGK